MTTVNVDLTGVANSTGPIDKVIFYSPVYREKNAGGLVSTREEVLILEDGVGSIDLEPGPVNVRFRVQGIVDTHDKRGMVPDAGPVGIEDVLYESFVYTPPVVSSSLSQIQDARDEAVQAVEGEFDEAMNRWFPVETAREGMGLLWDGDGFRWSWLDQFKDTFVDDH